MTPGVGAVADLITDRPTTRILKRCNVVGCIQQPQLEKKNSQMPRLISDAHEWINEIPNVPNKWFPPDLSRVRSGVRSRPIVASSGEDKRS